MIYPGGEFSDVTDKYISLDESGLVDGIYEAAGQGYIFTLHGTGYNSDGFTFIAGFDNDGTVSGFKALEQKETDGIGARCFEDGGDYENQILALNASDPIPLLSGATLTSTADQKGIDAAKAIFNDLQGISYDPNAQAATPEPAKAQPLANEDYSATGVTVEEVSNDGKTAVYHCTAKGFEGTNEADVTIDLESGTITSIAVTAFNDTPGVGDTATTDAELARYSGKGLSDMIDSTTGASMTSRSLRAMAANALSLATGTELTPGTDSGASGSGIGAEDFSEREAGCVVYTNLDETAFVYDCKATGYQGVNKAYVTVDTTTGTVKSIEVTEFNDTPGVGDTATTAQELARYEGATLESSVDATAGASMTSASIRAMAAAALNMAAGK
jgi:Na+-translocating ferredoxin:NAD+ oxidoreductase RnfG subunit